MPVDAAEIGRVFRRESGRVVAALVRRTGDIGLAEEAVQDAFLEASSRWPSTGLPPNPGGWIHTTARNRALDRLRRESSRRDRHQQATALYADPPEAEPDDTGGIVEDDRLRLIFTCCHPALAPESQVALTLRLIGGLHASEIARAFLVPEVTLRQRLTRAKAKIKATNIPYRVPGTDELPERLQSVLTVVYLIFNEGYTATAGEDLVRDDLCAEAIRLGRLLVDRMPDEPEAVGLLGLMLLIEARRRARVGPDGSLVILGEQDRGAWDRALVAEGQALVRRCLRRGEPGPYQIQAAINAVHSDAPTAADTDWGQIVQLYDLLWTHSPTAIVALNRGIALAERHGPLEGLRAIEGLGLDDYPPFHATRAELLHRLGRTGEAVAAWDIAASQSSNLAERRFLEARRDAARATLGG